LEQDGIEQQEWSNVFVILEDLLFSAGGLLNFSNRDIRGAVDNNFFKNDAERQAIHMKLGEFFKKVSLISWDDRVADFVALARME
jgi:hypothetical protein